MIVLSIGIDVFASAWKDEENLNKIDRSRSEQITWSSTINSNWILFEVDISRTIFRPNRNKERKKNSIEAFQRKERQKKKKKKRFDTVLYTKKKQKARNIENQWWKRTGRQNREETEIERLLDQRKAQRANRKVKRRSNWIFGMIDIRRAPDRTTIKSNRSQYSFRH